MSKGPNTKVYFGKAFHFPYALPDSRIFKDMLSEDGVITNIGGVDSCFVPPSSSVLSYF